MAGKIRQMIDHILDHAAKDNPMLARVIKTKMILKGVNPARFTNETEDDPAIIARLEEMMQTFSGGSRRSEAPAVQKSAAGTIKTAFSTAPNTADCVKEIRAALADLDPTLVVFFATSSHDPITISSYMKDAFPKSQVFGCSTAGEITSGQMLSNSVVAMGFSATAAPEIRIEVVKRPGQPDAIARAFGNFEKHFGEPVASMDPSRYVGILLIDGLAGVEESFMETLGDATNVPFIGGSAGDDLKFSGTHIYANGNSYTNAALIALLKPGVKFSFIKTQSFRFLGKTLKVTRANEADREVLQFNDRPAAQAYADALGVPVDEAEKRFMRNPIGLVVEGEPYVRSPQQIKGEAMAFYCGIKEGMKLSLLESTDIIGDTRKAISRAQQQLGSISGIVNFDCILRTLDLRQQNLCSEYGHIFADIPTVGFSTYGEQYIGHINQTATMLVFA